MDETNISTPDANITITDNTVEHIIYNTRTIKIDRSKLMKLIIVFTTDYYSIFYR